jgi:hypothetical protein
MNLEIPASPWPESRLFAEARKAHARIDHVENSSPPLLDDQQKLETNHLT